MKPEIKVTYKAVDIAQKDGSMQLCWLPIYVLSNAQRLEINTSADAAFLSMSVGNALKIKLDQLKNVNAIAEKRKLLTWIDKKAKKHPAEVFMETRTFANNPQSLEPLLKLGFDKDKITQDLLIIARLHDIGRLGEVDLLSGKLVDLAAVYGKGYNHAFESSAILDRMGYTREEIILPVQYHGVLNFEESLKQDLRFQKLSDKEKERVLFYGYVIRDTDRLANWSEKRITGVKGCSEEHNPQYSRDYNTTDSQLQAVATGGTCDCRLARTYADALLRWISWADQMHFPSMKVQSNAAVNDLWNRYFEEIEAAWNQTPPQKRDAQKYADVLKKSILTKNAMMKRLNPVYEVPTDENKYIQAKVKALIRQQER